MALRKRVFDKINRFSYNHLEQNFDEFAHTLRFPNNPKISLYGAHNSLFQNLLSKAFTDYLRVDSAALLDSKDAKGDVSESVARTITQVREDFSDKYVVVNFPQNTEQAEKLESLVDGINLAVNIQIAPESASEISKTYFECKACGLKFNTGVNSALPPFPGSTDTCPTPKLCNIVESTPVAADKVTEYDKKYKPVLDYYNKRGLLLNFEVCPKWTTEEATQKLIDAIGSHIKH